MKKTIFFFSIVVLSVSILLSQRAASAQSAAPATIRVAVIKDVDALTLTIKGRYEIYSLYAKKLLAEGKSLKNVRVSPTVSGLMVGKDPFKIFAIKIETSREASIFINGRRFRGSMDIVRTEDLKLLAVNHVDVESYLYGVLYHEVSPLWTMDALEAQAIIARTFALHQSRVKAGKDYDVTSDVYSQMYGGRTSEKWRTNRAVDLTRGKVLTFNGDIFPTYYHATCGGHTEDAGLLWDLDLKPLKGVWCPYCVKSPHYRWRQKMLLGEIEEKLNKNGYDIRGVYSIKIEGKDPSGRITDLMIKGSNSSVKIHSNRFRLIIGPNLLRSANFKITLVRGVALFEGIGWGHGVGLCQWGSYLMSKERHNLEEILRFYYPGSEIREIKSLSLPGRGQGEGNQ